MAPTLLTCLLFALAPKLALASVHSCFACAGPLADCVNNNRTDWLKMDCRDFLVEGESLAARTSEPALLEKFDSQVGPRRGDAEIACLALTYKRAGNRRAVKSCAPVRVLDRDVCDYMEELVAVVGGEGAECRLCDEDDCNSAPSLSPFLVLVVVGGWFCTVLQ